MNRIVKISASLVFLSFSAVAHKVAAADQSDPGWRLKLTGASLTSIGGGGFDSSFGGGVGLEYRTSDHFGFEVGAVAGKVRDEIDFGFLSIDTSLRVTPVLARLNWHLTPTHSCDLYLGPVAGWVRYGNFDVRVSALGEPSVLADRVENKDGFAWGGHIGLDVPFGRHGLFFTSDATYLKATVKPTAKSAAEGASDFDLDPLIIQAGIGFRF